MTGHETVVVFVTDGGYLGPSVQAAIQLVDQGIHESADIIIYTIGVDEHLVRLLRGKVGPAIHFVELSDDSYLPPEGVAFAKNHVPHSSLARLVISNHLPQNCRNIVYLDGDIQVVGDILPLVRHRVREGWIAAGRGGAWLDPDDKLGYTPPGYLSALNGPTKESYFNAGILACQRDTWATRGPEALKAFFANGERFLRHDQSALNSVFKKDVEPLSPAYNFHNVYAEARCDQILSPKIIHFTGPKKPWKDPVTPWGLRFHDSYIRLLQRFPEMEALFAVRQDPPLSARTKRFDLRGNLVRLRHRQAFRDYIKRENFAVM